MFIFGKLFLFFPLSLQWFMLSEMRIHEAIKSKRKWQKSIKNLQDSSTGFLHSFLLFCLHYQLSRHLLDFRAICSAFAPFFNFRAFFFGFQNIYTLFLFFSIPHLYFLYFKAFPNVYDFRRSINKTQGTFGRHWNYCHYKVFFQTAQNYET